MDVFFVRIGCWMSFFSASDVYFFQDVSCCQDQMSFLTLFWHPDMHGKLVDNFSHE